MIRTALIASLLAMNAVFGRFWDVQPVEAADSAAFKERSGDRYFIFDVQLHYVGAGYDPGDAEAGRKGADVATRHAAARASRNRSAGTQKTDAEAETPEAEKPDPPAAGDARR